MKEGPSLLLLKFWVLLLTLTVSYQCVHPANSFWKIFTFHCFSSTSSWLESHLTSRPLSHGCPTLTLCFSHVPRAFDFAVFWWLQLQELFPDAVRGFSQSLQTQIHILSFKQNACWTVSLNLLHLSDFEGPHPTCYINETIISSRPGVQRCRNKKVNMKVTKNVCNNY